METLGLLEATFWETELGSTSPTLKFSQLFNHRQWRRSPRLLTGLLGLLLAIFSPIFSAPIEILTPAAIAQTNNCVLLKRGDQGSSVSQLQTNLINKGYPVGNVDGIFGTNTEVALKSFQRSSDLDPDGIYGPVTCNALTGTVTAIQSQPLGATATVAKAQPATTPSNTNSILLRQGDQGEAVSNLQQKLQLLGARIGVTGNFDNATRGAVENFQRSQGLEVDGIVGSQTNKSLENALLAGRTLTEDLRTDNFTGSSILDNIGKYVVAIPARSNISLADIQQFAPNAQVRRLRRGTFVHAGGYENREMAEGVSYLLRSQGFDARVIAQ
ncbi:MAG: peptidoglycan-binding protein [Limnothrix sp. RL_2_0]|nr:peptidoglycan-binding protein [Limnothrix sp. RL_2_0]